MAIIPGVKIWEHMPHYHASWDDMSEYLVHFTKTYENRAPYENMLSICWGRRFKALNKFGIGRKVCARIAVSKDGLFQRSSASPQVANIEETRRIRDRLQEGDQPPEGRERIWYVEKDTTNAQQIHALMTRASGSKSPKTEPIWFFTPFIDIQGEYGKGSYRFEWERERSKRDDFAFEVDDVAFLVLPGGPPRGGEDILLGPPAPRHGARIPVPVSTQIGRQTA